MAGRKGGEKTRCGGRWTEAAFSSFIKNNLRNASRKWQPIQECLKNARTRRGFYICNGCKNEVPASAIINGKRTKNVAVDHVEPIIDPTIGFTTWDDCIERMFVEIDGLQVLCYDCHSKKGQEETALRKETRSNRKLFPAEESSYRNMMSRCTNPNATGYEYYGGRGIKVCDRWAESFNNFLEDMGPRPEGTTIDREDYNGNYEPSNCRWATHKEQGNNQSNNHYISLGGDTRTLQEWADFLNIKPNTILYRLRRGWTTEEALELVERKRPHTSKLTEDQWNEIQKLRDDGYTTVALSKMFDVDAGWISRKTKAKND